MPWQEKEAEVEERLQALASGLHATEKHKRFLERANWLLTAAAREMLHQQARI